MFLALSQGIKKRVLEMTQEAIGILFYAKGNKELLTAVHSEENIPDFFALFRVAVNFDGVVKDKGSKGCMEQKHEISLISIEYAGYVKDCKPSTVNSVSGGRQNGSLLISRA